ncbi:UDP-N-acetylhexosamine pyrophosphorylase-like [Euwallacea fornicatus]|uniref:UDP-N-acetylhexosamine pyrophosphorylase-like n=1 Tax=Euwallacea fornicatus TaxID=995702 RepID=UPI00338D39D6
MSDLEDIKKLLEECNQSHLLKYWNDLNESQQKDFLAHLKSIDFKEALWMWHKAEADFEECDKITEDDLMPVDVEVEKDLPHSTIEEYRSIGLEEISNNKVAVIVLAGGQGTRLGMPYPKGICPTGIPSGKTLFQLQAERIQCLEDLAKLKTGKSGTIYWYLMTSEATHMLTEKFLIQNRHFGLNKDQVTLFKQTQIPCFDMTGRIILEEKDEVATSPDGNGGLFKALQEQGMLEDLQKKGIKYVHVHSVDNILVKVADPVFIGKCVKDNVDCGLKVIKKTDPTEPLGVVVLAMDKIDVVEYTELPPTTAALLSHSRENLVFNAGNICNHFFTVDFLKDISSKYEFDLRLHMSKKIVTQIGPDGDKILPPVPNCIKIEKFVFDVITYAKNFLVWQVERTSEFSPVKNSDVSKRDCFATAKRDLLALHKTWVENNGGKCQGAGVEVSPRLSYEGEGLDFVRGKEFKENEVLITDREQRMLDRKS